MDGISGKFEGAGGELIDVGRMGIVEANDERAIPVDGKMEGTGGQ